MSGLVLDLTKPMTIRAEMARHGLAPGHLHHYDDPERGWRNPLNEGETQSSVRSFLAALWQACLHEEAS